VLVSRDGIDYYDGGIVGDVVHDDHHNEVAINNVHDVSQVQYFDHVPDVVSVHDFNHHAGNHHAGNHHDSYLTDDNNNGHPFGTAGDRFWRHGRTPRHPANSADSWLAFAGRVLGRDGL
jgi:hypothetical protein